MWLQLATCVCRNNDFQYPTLSDAPSEKLPSVVISPAVLFDKKRGYQDSKEKCLAVNRITWNPAAVSWLYSNYMHSENMSSYTESLWGQWLWAIFDCLTIPEVRLFGCNIATLPNDGDAMQLHDLPNLSISVFQLFLWLVGPALWSKCLNN